MLIYLNLGYKSIYLKFGVMIYLLEDPLIYNVAIMLLLIIGMTQCFLGFKMFKTIISIVGFTIGLYIGHNLGESTSVTMSILYSLGAALFCAVILYFFHYVGVFLLGSAIGALISTYILRTYNIEVDFIAVILSSIAGGLLTIYLNRIVIIATTAFTGALIVIIGAFYFIEEIDPLELLSKFTPNTISEIYIIIFLWLVLALSGVIVQYKTVDSLELRL